MHLVNGMQERVELLIRVKGDNARNCTELTVLLRLLKKESLMFLLYCTVYSDLGPQHT